MFISHRLYNRILRASGVQYTDPEHTIRWSIASTNYARAQVPNVARPMKFWTRPGAFSGRKGTLPGDLATAIA